MPSRVRHMGADFTQAISSHSSIFRGQRRLRTSSLRAATRRLTSLIAVLVYAQPAIAQAQAAPEEPSAAAPTPAPESPVAPAIDTDKEAPISTAAPVAPR